MSERFKMCDKLGLQVCGGRGSEFVNANDVEKLLAGGEDVFSATGCAGWSTNKNGDVIIPYDRRGVVVNIQPIERDTAESILRELVELPLYGTPIYEQINKIVERAKKVVREK